MLKKNNIQEPKADQIKKIEQRLGAFGWGLFFIWIGIAIFAHIGWGVSLLGVGLIILGCQTIRNYMGLTLDGFWVIMGILFFLSGIWRLLNIEFDLFPIMCIIAGMAFLASIVVGKVRNHKSGSNNDRPEATNA